MANCANGCGLIFNNPCYLPGRNVNCAEDVKGTSVDCAKAQVNNRITCICKFLQVEKNRCGIA